MMPLWERLAWWALARAVRRYRNGPVDQVHHPRWSVMKDMHRRLDGVFHLTWPEGGDA